MIRAVSSRDFASKNSGSFLESGHKESYEWKFLPFASKMITETKNWKANPLLDIQKYSNPSTDRTGGDEREHINRNMAVELIRGLLLRDLEFLLT